VPLFPGEELLIKNPFMAQNVKIWVLCMDPLLKERSSFGVRSAMALAKWKRKDAQMLRAPTMFITT